MVLNFAPYTRSQLEAALGRLGRAVYSSVAPLEIRAWRTPEPVPFTQRQTGEALVLQLGDRWGNLFDCAWFHFSGQVPAAAAGQPVVLLLDVSGEMCVFDAQGEPLRGLTNVFSEYDYSLGTPGKRVLPLFDHAQGDEKVSVWADAGCNDLFGNLKNDGRIREAHIAICHEPLRQLYYDFEVLLDSLRVLPEKSPRFQQILAALNDAVHLLWNGITPELAQPAREILGRVLQQRGGDPSLQISAIGHAHIDLGWLWPIRETKRKGARTFATALANQELYPNYTFAASQAQLFQWMKESYPGLYQRIRRQVQAGRLEPQGALWVECDTNVTGGESLVRQILYGRLFFRQELGVDPQYVWLPDTFGYSAALPQILHLAGIPYFSTQKLSWSLINVFPHHSFHWQGLDGSSVLVHMLPEETYNSPASARSIARIESNYAEKGVSQHALLVFGIGDGGGGPGEEHIERLERLVNFAGLSPVKQEWTAAFFEKWAKDAGRFPTWAGELYLERHQGTLTTNARNKRANRHMEQALRELEWVAVLAQQEAGVPYPAQPLLEIWREVLLYQFHDILPGSSIKRVYDESLARYEHLQAEVEALIGQRQQALAQKLDLSGYERPALVFNSLSWPRTEWVQVGDSWHRVQLPALGYTTLDLAQHPTLPAETLIASADCLENEVLRARFGAQGTLTSLFDKAEGRELIAQGEAANELLVFTDLGDAWDFPMDYAESQPRHMALVGARAWRDGPAACLEQVYRLGHSELVLQIRLLQGSSRLEFSARLRWRETQTMLRVRFPLAIQAQEASYEIQFGHVRRPTHRNTTWDLARDEVAGQKWVDLSQRDYGVALLNDCKYGHKVKGHTIDLNLLRSVPYPGAKVTRDEDFLPGEPNHGYTDQADHLIRYALFAHRGDAVTAQVAQQAYEFNLPPRICETQPGEGSAAPERSFIQVDAANVIVETVKQAEDGAGWIVRLYEAGGEQTAARITFNPAPARLEEVDLMEESPRSLDLQSGQARLDFRPFEIKSLRCRN